MKKNIFKTEGAKKAGKVIKLIAILATAALLIALGIYILARGNAKPEYSSTLTQELLNLKLGPLQLGMQEEEVRAILGDPDDVSNSGEIMLEDGSTQINWFYRTNPNAVETLHDVSVSLRDTGSGKRVDCISVFSEGDWALPNGITIGTPAKTVKELCENFTVTEDVETTDGVPVEIAAFTQHSGDLYLCIVVKKGEVTNIELGGFFPPPPMEKEP